MLGEEVLGALGMSVTILALARGIPSLAWTQIHTTVVLLMVLTVGTTAMD